MSTSVILALSALVVIVVGCAVLICASRVPGLNVITGAKPTGPASMPPPEPEPEPYNALPWEPNPKGPGALLAADRQYRTAQQDRSDYDASLRARHTESLADWERRNADLSARLIAADAAAGLLDQHVPTARKETQ
jgi:hypothetical protein